VNRNHRACQPAEQQGLALENKHHDDRCNDPPTTPPRADGFNDIDSDGTGGSIIKGTKLKFTNAAEWIDDNGAVIKPDREFIVIGMVRASQKWLDDVPIETIILGPNDRFPDVEEMNEACPRSEWCVKFGKDTGPWQRCWFAYLLDPKTMAGFTWPAGTIGGFRALSTLKEATIRARMLQGANVFPVVTLTDVPMRTQYGVRQRPHFVIRGFHAIGGPEPPALAKPAAADKNADINDEIKY
jgi:hypothetical protein